MNRQVHLIRYPDGVPTPADFALAEAPMPVPGAGEVLLGVDCLGLDPFPRLRMRADSRLGPPVPLNAVVDGRGIATVLESRCAGLEPGDVVHADTGWQTHVALPGAGLEPLDLSLGRREAHLSVLGPSGLTGWLTARWAARAQQTLVIAPAAGSVGVVAAQLAVAAGARVIGITASDAQAAWVEGELRISALPSAALLANGLAEPVHGFIDGVGGALHDAVIRAMAPQGRVLLLGFIAGYNEKGPPHYGSAAPLLLKRLTAQGFLLADYCADFADARAGLGRALASGGLRAFETIHQGIETTAEAFAGLFADPPPGKQIIRISDRN
jgi:NADPH-dependent curcumin reductase CurA